MRTTIIALAATTIFVAGTILGWFANDRLVPRPETKAVHWLIDKIKR